MGSCRAGRAVCLLLAGVVAACCLAATSATSQAAAPQPVATATPQLTVDVRAGFDGFYKAGEWLPIFAVAANEGPPIDGVLSLTPTPGDRVLGSYGALANLPTHSRKLLSFTAPALGTQGVRAITLAQGARTLLTEPLNLTALSGQDYLYGVISPTSGAMDALRGQRQFGGTVAVAHLSLNDLPSVGPALADLDALVIDNTATTALTPQQRQTVSGWVADGGQLVLTGGAGAAETLAAFADLSPVQPTGTQEADPSAALAPWGAGATGGREVLATAQPVAGSIVRLRTGTVPLVVDRPWGHGWVTFLAFDAATPALQQGPGAVSLWQHILSNGRATTTSLDENFQGIAGSPGTGIVYALPETVLPSGGLLAVLLYAYVFAVGPLNYGLLRRLDRRELLWLTVPAISLLFSGLAYGMAHQIKGNQVIVNTVTVTQSAQRQPISTVQADVGIFSPGRTSYDVQVSGVAGAIPLDLRPQSNTPAALAEGNGVLLRNVRVEKWSMRAFDLRGSSTAGPPIDSALTLTGNTISGWVRNVGKEPLEGVLLVVGSDRAELQNLAPGQTSTVRLVLSGSVAPVTSPPGGGVVTDAASSEARRREALVESVLGSRPPGTYPAGPVATTAGLKAVGGVQVLGFSTTAPFDVGVAGHHVQRHDLTLNVVSVPVTSGSGVVTVPYGFARRDLLENSGAIRTASLYAPWLPLGTTATFQFSLPSDLVGLKWTSVHLRVQWTAAPNNIGGPSTPTIALYNWSSGQWDAQRAFGNGVNSVTRPDLYVDPRGLLRVQITGGNGHVNLQTLDVDATGERQ